MKTVAIVQARMGSTRLPGKVLLDIAGRPMLGRVLDRARRARTLDLVGVATTDRPADEPVARFCESEGVPCFRGSEEDVLARFRGAASRWGADVVVRITADCPLLDPAVVDRVVGAFRGGDFDYVSNTIRYTWPDGLDCEVFSSAALDRAFREAERRADREHVTPYLKSSGRFRVASVENEEPMEGRWTVDDPADLEFVRRVFEAFPGNRDFSASDVARLLRERPETRRREPERERNEGYYLSLFRAAGERPAAPLALERSKALFERAKRTIPGCSQTFSKGYTQYVQGVAPLFLESGKGCRVRDADGNEYVDYVQGLLPNILGYADERVNAAVSARIAGGHSFSLPHRLEVELAEKLCALIPCAERVRFGKNGSDATSGAIRAARAFTGRDRVACCGYHGWQDWYIGSTTRNRGVPGAVRALTHPFPYNDLPALERILSEHPGEFAAVILEPVSFTEPHPGYLAALRETAHRHGALLVFDEICTGFRLGLGGAQARYGVTPDLACFGKAMGNGFPISCVVGRADVMEVFSEIFFSFTFAGEAASLAAALATIEVLETTDALRWMEEQGRRVKDGFNVLAREAGLADRCSCIGHDAWSKLVLKDAQGRECLLTRGLLQQEMVRRGVLLLVTHNMTSAHDAPAVERTLEAYASSLRILARQLSDPDPARHLAGEPIRPVFTVR